MTLDYCKNIINDLFNSDLYKYIELNHDIVSIYIGGSYGIKQNNNKSDIDIVIFTLDDIELLDDIFQPDFRFYDKKYKINIHTYMIPIMKYGTINLEEFSNFPFVSYGYMLNKFNINNDTCVYLNEKYMYYDKLIRDNLHLIEKIGLYYFKEIVKPTIDNVLELESIFDGTTTTAISMQILRMITIYLYLHGLIGYDYLDLINKGYDIGRGSIKCSALDTLDNFDKIGYDIIVKFNDLINTNEININDIHNTWHNLFKE